ERVVPSRHVLLVVAAQPGKVEVEARAFGERQQLGKPVERLRGGLVRPVDESAEPQVNPNDGGPQVSHLTEGLLHRRPLVLPIVLEQASSVVVIVIEAPGDKLLTAGGTDESSLVFRELNPRQFVASSDSNRQPEQDPNDSRWLRHPFILQFNKEARE